MVLVYRFYFFPNLNPNPYPGLEAVVDEKKALPEKKG
jgi:hypothetical protein